ncbi:MAG: thiol peroxidase [Desulfovibrio sp.]|nr:thiol peroxidase [Desulfovibrio sp.]
MATVTFSGNTLHLVGTLPKTGETLPGLSLTTNDLSVRPLSHYAGKILVLVAVPSLDTPVCDMEVRRFNKEATALSEDVAIVAVSRDLPFAQARWCGASQSTRVETLSDYRNGSFGKALGIYIEELDLLARAVFVLDRNQVLTYRYLVPEVTNEPNYEEVLSAIKDLL